MMFTVLPYLLAFGFLAGLVTIFAVCDRGPR